jgi:hypothetical protein
MQGGTLQGPAFRRESVSQEVLTGEDEAPLVALDLPWQPPGAGFGADEDEQRGSRYGLCEIGGGVLEDEALEPPLPAAVHDLGVITDVDVLRRIYLLYQVVGHARGKRATAHQHRDAGGVP